MNRTTCYHIITFLIVCVWGTTYVSSKILINNGLTPAQIFFVRFAIAYLLIVVVCHRRLFAETWKDELRMLSLGITGGSLYFLAENTALAYSTASNVSLIVCSCPMVSTLLLAAMYKEERLSKLQYAGSVLALLGMAVVVLNGHFVLHLSPRGDILALVACLCWGVYNITLRGLVDRYPSLFITRKIFFYGLVTILPYLLYTGLPAPVLLMRGEVAAHLLFLSIVASFLCYFLWNKCVQYLGVQQAGNWIYFNPIATIVSAWIMLGERPTAFLFLGTAMILWGMYLADKKR